MDSRADAAEHILIVGTGALATLFAARLGTAGYAVSLLGSWQAGLRALQENGARLLDSSNQEIRVPVHAVNDAALVAGTRHALVLLKSWQTEGAAHQLKNCLAPDGLVLTMQNGLGNRELLSGALGAERVALGSTTTGATLLGPGLAKAGGEGNLVLETHDRLGPMHEALIAAGFHVEVVPDARALVWNKLVINSAINPLTAILRVPNGQLLERPAARRLLHALALETAAVARAEKIQLPSPDPIKLVESVARGTAANFSSMYQDVQRGAPTEIDAICGAVTRAGMKHNVPTPLNAACWELVQAMIETPANPRAS